MNMLRPRPPTYLPSATYHLAPPTLTPYPTLASGRPKARDEFRAVRDGGGGLHDHRVHARHRAACISAKFDSN